MLNDPFSTCALVYYSETVSVAVMGKIKHYSVAYFDHITTFESL